MSIHISAHSPGVFIPQEITLLRALLNDMRGETWFPKRKAEEERLAGLLIKSYDRGTFCPTKLRAFCAAAANVELGSSDTAP